MVLPPKNKEKIFEELLQDLPTEFKYLAIEFKAFTRGRKIKTVEELLRMVLLYCGLDLSFREVASNMTLLDERITDEAVRKRLNACQPWVKALLSNMLDSKKLDKLPSGFRFCAFDGSSIQASRQKFFSKTFASKAATGTDYRLHIGIDLVTLEFTHLLVTDKRTGESLKHYSLSKGDVAVVDRGYCHAFEANVFEKKTFASKTIYEKKTQGSDVIVRYNHATMPLYKDDGTPLDLISELKNSNTNKVFSVSAKVKSKDKNNNQDSDKLEGYLIVQRLPEADAKAARKRCQKKATKQSFRQKFFSKTFA